MPTKQEPLFLKPLYYPGDIIFSRTFIPLQKKINFRSFDLDKDLDMIHRWVNMDYALPFWRLPLSESKLYQLYYSIQRNFNAHSYLGLLGDDPVCLFDVYRVTADEIDVFINAGPHDCGFHLLMAPNDKPITKLSTAIITAYLDYYFSFPEASVMYAEPDILNHRSNRLLRIVGFHPIQQIIMSYKTARLYSITKQQFHARGQHLIH